MTIFNEELNPRFLSSLSSLPSCSDLCLVVRHSTRGPIPPGVQGDDVLLTDDGHTLAASLGKKLVGHGPWAIYSSSIPRCVQTATAMCQGAKRNLPITVLPQLVSPAALQIAAEEELWEQHFGPVELVNLLLPRYQAPISTEVPPVVADILRCAFSPTSLRQSDREQTGSGTLRLVVTHDDVIAFAFAFLLAQESISISDLPWMLEGFFIWNEGEQTSMLWRGKVFPLRHQGIQSFLRDEQPSVLAAK